MIAALTGWIKGIIYIVLFAAFLEFLLPSGQMRKFIRVIIGLFIMLAVLNPIVTVLSRGQPDELLPTWRDLGREDRKSKGASAEELVTMEQEMTRNVYKKELSRQIRAVVMTIAGVGDAQVTVDLEQAKSNQKNGAIRVVTITLQKRGPTDITPVVIGHAVPEDTGPSEELKAKVVRTVGETVQLSQQKIIVQ
ncbi:stage III sporulation protein AF [Sporomusaceae bacterium BoRhaA]|uniref:stage III sporulation protein AF n=1 Tax=Pelorhabdus rhamnosifermentans TaxID=2772457 RepID=UPI001C0615AE|nr:stage III sporulation protein AF [Pelorhabdus rhamnosifermentans]MBU2700934.1 stage III sporulation protein AF [Pelorhabdus rhamnosifermentans]